MPQAYDPDAVVPSGTEARVCADIARRQQLGIAKYGTTVAKNPLELREWLQHAYEEMLDQVIYLRRAIEELDKPKGPANTRGSDWQKVGENVNAFFEAPRECLTVSTRTEDTNVRVVVTNATVYLDKGQ